MKMHLSTLLHSLIRIVLLVAVISGSQISVAGLIISRAGANEVVSDWQKDKCRPEDFTDSPARAFRRDDGNVVLFAPHFFNYFFSGKDLNSVRPTCKPVYLAPMDPVPENYNARVWLQTFYTEDGKQIYSLGSSDYHGGWFGKCEKQKGNPDCWWSAIVLATSNDGGATFQLDAPPKHIIARAPYNYPAETGHATGFFTTSNIVKREAYYYSLIFTFGHGAQKTGSCLMRTTDIADARSWRTWNGVDFGSEFVSPEPLKLDNSEKFNCKPVGQFPGPVRSLLWHAASQQYIATFGKWVRVEDALGKRVRIEFQYSSSKDLLQWSAAQTIDSYESKPDCPRILDSVAYPSMLDPSSQDRNFGTVGDTAYIYFTRFNREDGCKPTLNRDLLRFPIRIKNDN